MPEQATAATNYLKIKEEIENHAKKHDIVTPQLVSVSKTFDAEAIKPVIKAGCRVFGENRVQEAQGKWPELQRETSEIELHLIGPLQSNKAADAVELFDSIQTIDREKIAKAVSKEMEKQGKQLKLFVQINTGSEVQKAGILPENALEFVQFCKNDMELNLEGLMCIPPFDENPGPHFALLRKLAREAGVSGLSMGMSADYLIATEFNATHVRVGSSIFGGR